ncbi:MAG: metallopeptidase family protein [Acidobacteria bacterium]|nr:metallopeptidase family protein [Acidobacteriota bacterium]
MVADAISEIPDELRDRLENVEIVIEDEPDPALLEDMGLDPDEDTLLGLYQGVPLTQRTSQYGLVLPDKISIYQFPIEDSCETLAQMKLEVQRTVVHEIAHHFGISDERLEELGF